MRLANTGGRKQLVADSIRDNLLRLVEPFLTATLANLDEKGRALAEGRGLVEITMATGERREFECKTVALLQHTPLMLRLLLLGMPKAVELERFDGGQVPGLREAVDDVLAGVLAALPEGDDELAVMAASRRRGGFLATLDLETGRVDVMVAKPGEDLSAGVVLGAICAAPAVAN